MSLSDFVAASRRPRLAAVLALLLLAACEETGTVNRTAGYVGLSVNTVGNYVYATGGFRDLTFAGAWIAPRNVVVAAALGEAGAAGRRLQMHLIDVDPASLSYGDVVARFPDVFTGSRTARGVAATSFVDGDGNVDAIFALIDESAPGVRIFDLQGESADPFPSGGDLVVPDYAADADPYITPAVEAGRLADGTTRILIAYGIGVAPDQYIRLGFLNATAPGEWSLEPTDLILINDFSGCVNVAPGRRTALHFNLALAFDADRAEWGLGFKCGSSPWGAHLVRIATDGRLIPGSELVAHEGVDDAHSPVRLSFNRFTRRYFFQFEHNSALIDASTDTLTCARVATNTCETVRPTGGGFQTVWASEVDYGSGFEFRVGKEDRSFLEGESWHLLSGAKTGTDFLREGADLWPAHDPAWFVEAHDYVRAPGVSTAVALHVWEDPGNALGTLRYTFLDEAATPAVDE